MFTRTSTGSNLEITETVTDFGCIPCVPHALQACSAVHLETFSPKTVRPLHSIQFRIRHAGIFTSTHIRQSR